MSALANRLRNSAFAQEDHLAVRAADALDAAEEELATARRELAAALARAAEQDATIAAMREWAAANADLRDALAATLATVFEIGWRAIVELFERQRLYEHYKDAAYKADRELDAARRERIKEVRRRSDAEQDRSDAEADRDEARRERDAAVRDGRGARGMSLLRKVQEGWEPLAMHDPAGRRGLWMRETPDGAEGQPPTTIELCSGREGYDAEVTIRVGEVLTPETFSQLREVLGYARWAYELGIDGGATPAELHQRLRAVEPCTSAELEGGAHFWKMREGDEHEEFCQCGAWRRRVLPASAK